MKIKLKEQGKFAVVFIFVGDDLNPLGLYKCKVVTTCKQCNTPHNENVSGGEF
jgi:hypothetical protein